MSPNRSWRIDFRFLQINTTCYVTAVPSDVGIVLLGEDGGDSLLYRLRDWLTLQQRIVYADPALSEELGSFLSSVGICCVPPERLQGRGRAAWRNEAIAVMVCTEQKPKFVQWLRSESELSPHWLCEAVNYLSKNPRVGLARGRVEIVGNSTARARLYEADCNVAVGHCTSFPDEALIRLQAFEIVAGFDESLSAMDETEFVGRLGWHGWDAQMLNTVMTRRGYKPSGWYRWLCEQVSIGSQESNLLAHCLAPAVRFGRRQRWRWFLISSLSVALMVAIATRGNLLLAAALVVMVAVVGMIKAAPQSHPPTTSSLKQQDLSYNDWIVTALSTAFKMFGDLKYCVSHDRRPMRNTGFFGAYQATSRAELAKSATLPEH